MKPGGARVTRANVARKTARIPLPVGRTFGQCAGALHAEKKHGWRNAKHAKQWLSLFSMHCASIWNKPIAEVDTQHVAAVMETLRARQPETARRLRAKIFLVLEFAAQRGYLPEDKANPARFKSLAPARPKGGRAHHSAMPYAEVPVFMARLAEVETVSSLALRFLILTAARAGEVLGARWDEIDLSSKTWTVPSTRMKSGRGHRVPLSNAALEVIARMDEVRSSDYVFPGARRGRPLSAGALSDALHKLVPLGASVHGFRSAFRDWAGDKTSFPREVAEGALAHTLGGTEAAYRRGDALEKRRALMVAWADYIEREEPSNVVVDQAHDEVNENVSRSAK